MYWYLLGGIPVHKNPISLWIKLSVFTWWVSQLLTSMLTKKCVVADGAGFSKGVELVQPFSGDVKLQQAGLLHIGQGHDFLPLPHWLLTVLPVWTANVGVVNVDYTWRGFWLLTYRTTRRLQRSAQLSHGPLWHTGHQTHTTDRWSHSDSKQCNVHLHKHKCAWEGLWMLIPVRSDRISYFLQCHGDKWLTAGRMWWPEKDCLWPEKAACWGPPAGRKHGCWS